jgi:hypothetical protein
MMEAIHWRERSVVELLRRSGKLKTVDIINNSNMCKVTTLKYIKRLRKRGVIDFEKIGPTKLWYVQDKSDRKNPDKRGRLEEQKRVFELLRDFEEMTGVKANVIITSKGVALALGDPEFNVF